ncbi:MAG: SWIM zinc finger family protein [Candidatus Sericytochromatia bacterium]
MLFNYSYKGNSTINNLNSSQTNMSFVPDTNREPTFFNGELAKSLEFREAMSALHDVVISDMRLPKKDKTEYKAWAEQQEQIDFMKVAIEKEAVKEKIEVLEKELKVINNSSYERMKPFYEARQKYFDYLYKKEKDVWFVLDPVITVHPDEVFFECFSMDESSYGKLSVDYSGFKDIKEFSCGTTNIDYSEDLYQEFQKIRTYKSTFFNIDPSGFEVKTENQDDFKEVKIDLPDSWVRGFLQVNSAMSLPSTKVDLHPIDVYNICFILKRKKETLGPRSMKYILKPNQPIKIIFEPWNIELECPRSIYYGEIEQEIRVWGRRRILILERLIQLAKKFTVYLLGNGMPSFYIADLVHMSFTLGLSGWSANDWSKSSNFDLMAPRAEVDDITKQTIFKALKSNWYEKPEKLAKNLNLDKSLVLGALSAYTQAGRTIFDLNKNVYRIRELTKDPLPMGKLRFANEREEKASKFISEKSVSLSNIEENNNKSLKLDGLVIDKDKSFYPSIEIDSDQKLSFAKCDCNWYNHNKLYKGPCEHMLAIRMFYNKTV